jgi:hypothetical protein
MRWPMETFSDTFSKTLTSPYAKVAFSSDNTIPAASEAPCKASFGGFSN